MTTSKRDSSRHDTAKPKVSAKHTALNLKTGLRAGAYDGYQPDY
jgi:hypothetical protein